MPFISNRTALGALGVRAMQLTATAK